MVNILRLEIVLYAARPQRRRIYILQFKVSRFLERVHRKYICVNPCNKYKLQRMISYDGSPSSTVYKYCYMFMFLF